MSSSTVTPGSLYIGRGEVYFDRFDTNGNATGERFVGNATKFEITTNDDIRDKFSSAESTAPLLLSVNVRRTVEVSMEFDELDNPNVAIGLMGTETTLSQGSGTVAMGEVVTARLDKWVPTAKRNISSLVVKNAAESVTYVLGTDYKQDLVTGRIFAITGGAITDAQTLHVGYSYGVVSLPKVQAGTSNFINGKIRFISQPATGPQWEIEIWKVAIQPDGAIGFLADDYASIPVKARVLADTTNHPTEPYYQAIKRT